MAIPPFTLPSNPGQSIHLREATVADCEQFADTDPRHAERVTTLILRTLQSDPAGFVDPLTWTREDRAVAAFWYFAHTSEDTSLHLPYACPHCGEQHDALQQFTELAAAYQPIKGLPHRFILHKDQRLKVIPLDGYAAEELELLRAQADPDDPQSVQRANALCTRHEVVASIQPDTFQGSRDARIERMEAWVRDLPLSEFKALRAQVQAMQADMQHGLPTVSEHGELFILSAPQPCDKEAGHTTRLRFPFFLRDYLPRL